MLLSIITTGRNDNYCGNFIHRITLQVEKHCSNIDSLGLTDVEIVVVDWGSETEKLSDVIKIKRPYLKYVHVPFEVSNQIAPFSNSHAWNVGARKSSGKYMLHTEGDFYMPLKTFKNLYDFIKERDGENVYSWSSRIHIPHSCHSNVSTISEVDDLIENFIKNGKRIWADGSDLKYENINESNFQGSGGSQLTSRDLYFDVTGIAECYTKWGVMDIDFHNRVTSKYDFTGDLEKIVKSEFFALGHHEIGVGFQVHGANVQRHTEFKANPDNWGLAEIDIKIYQ
jgi:hypothetical protein